MKKKKLSIFFVIILFILTVIFIVPHNKISVVAEVVSPKEFVIDNESFSFNNLDCFDSTYTEHNKTLAKSLNITETEAFLLGNLGKNWAENLMKGRSIFIDKNDDLIFLKYGYKDKFLYSGFCIKDGEPFYKEGFERKLNGIRKTKYQVLDLDNDISYEPDDTKVRGLKNFIVVRKSHLPRHLFKKTAKTNPIQNIIKPQTVKDFGGIKIFFSDSTTKIKPTNKCESDICKELLFNINKAKTSIDMAIYGYSKVPEIETALLNAQTRGVKVRLVYDLNQKGENIYPDTAALTKLIPNNMSDIKSSESASIMHNKFYIFDDKILITGSANLSHTDMSGFNSNSIIVVDSVEIAKLYKFEFEQMFSGKFHNSKKSNLHKQILVGNTKIDIYFSPKDKGIENAILPLIKRAKNYIYIPTFMITDKSVTEALISAKKRGVDVKILVDALNASAWHSKHNELRLGNIPVKTENYAGKMHSKSIIVDDLYTIVGSMNFSNTGNNKNDENLVLIENPNIAKAYKEFFLYQWKRVDNRWLKLNARAEGKDSIGSCSDGIDNNFDGLIDSEDPACISK